MGSSLNTSNQSLESLFCIYFGVVFVRRFFYINLMTVTTHFKEPNPFSFASEHYYVALFPHSRPQSHSADRENCSPTGEQNSKSTHRYGFTQVPFDRDRQQKLLPEHDHLGAPLRCSFDGTENDRGSPHCVPSTAHQTRLPNSCSPITSSFLYLFPSFLLPWRHTCSSPTSTEGWNVAQAKRKRKQANRKLKK